MQHTTPWDMVALQYKRATLPVTLDFCTVLYFTCTRLIVWDWTSPATPFTAAITIVARPWQHPQKASG